MIIQYLHFKHMWYPGTQGYEIASEYHSDKDKMTVYNSNLDTQIWIHKVHI